MSCFTYVMYESCCVVVALAGIASSHLSLVVDHPPLLSLLQFVVITIAAAVCCRADLLT